MSILRALLLTRRHGQLEFQQEVVGHPYRPLGSTLPRTSYRPKESTLPRTPCDVCVMFVCHTDVQKLTHQHLQLQLLCCCSIPQLTSACVCVHLFVHVWVHACVCMCVRVCVCMCVYIYLSGRGPSFVGQAMSSGWRTTASQSSCSLVS